MKNYIVKMKEKNKNGTVTTRTLTEGNEWQESTNNPMRFFNIKQAGKYAVEKFDPSKVSMYIEGPKGGRYSVVNGKQAMYGWR